jgi:hypothetical protein
MPAGTENLVATSVLIGHFPSDQEALDPDTGDCDDELEPKL